MSEDVEAAVTIDMPHSGPEVALTGAIGASAELRELGLSFGGQKVLDGVNLDLRPGEIALLRGDNGSGKTVLLNVMAGHMAPDRGSVRLNLGGRWIDVARTSPESIARRGVGRLWQDIRLFPSMSVLDNVLAGTSGMLGENPLLALMGRPLVTRQEREARERALLNLATVGMEDRARSSCDMLSIGQMKRVAVARLLQMDATLLLLDEPFAGLDAAGVASFAFDIARLRDEQHKTILVVEHRHEAIAAIADRVLKMASGRLEEVSDG